MTLPQRLGLLVLIDILLLGALGVLIWADNATNRGITYAPDLTEHPIMGADGPMVGVNAFHLHLEPESEAVTRTLQLAHDMGVRYIRFQLPWEDVEIHGRGDFEDRRNVEQIGVVSAWEKYDRIVDAANELGLELIMRIDRAPMWASPVFKSTDAWEEGIERDPTSTGPPDDFVDYYRFVGIVAERYRGKVHFFQIWNEPNLANEWNWQTPDPVGFAWFLCSAHDSIKAVNPDAKVVFPSLAPVDGLDKRAPMTELEYLERVYQEIGPGCFDIMSVQGYGLGQPPDEYRYVRLRPLDNWVWTRPIDTRVDVGRVIFIREIMEQYENGHKPIWFSEFGWNSAPDSIPEERRFTWGAPVSEEQKADYLIGHLERARNEWPWVGVMHIWMLRYGGYQEPHPDDPTPYFAIVDREWQPLPAYERLREYLAQPAVAGPGMHSWEHPAIEQTTEGWRIRFRGEHVALIGEPGVLAGVAEMQLDGEQVSVARETLATGEEVVRPLSSMPAQTQDSVHVLELIGPDAAAPTRFAVSRSAPLPWLWIWGPALLVGLLLVSGGATMHTMMLLLDRQVAHLPQDRASVRVWLTTPAGERVLLLAMFASVLVLYRGSSQLPMSMMAMVMFGLLALCRADLALLFVPLTVPFFFIPKAFWDSGFGGAVDGMTFPLHEILLLISAGAFAIQTLMLWYERGGNEYWALWNSLLRHRGRVAAVGAFLLIGTVAVVIVPAEGRGAALREWRWLIVEPVIWYGLLHLSIWHIARSVSSDAADRARQFTHRMLWFFVMGGAVVGLVGMLQFMGLNLAPFFGEKVGFSDSQVFVEGVQRVSSVYGHPNNLGLFMGRVWPLAVVLVVIVLLRREGYGWVAIAVACSICAVGGLAVSFSKGAWVGAFGALLVLVFFLEPRPQSQRPGIWGIVARHRWLVGVLIVGGIGFAIAMLFVGERLNPFGETSSIRLKTWASSLAMIRDHPLFGIGLDQFVVHYQHYIDPLLADTNERNTSHPHNLILDIWLRMGIAGVVLFIWLLMGFFRQALPDTSGEHKRFPQTETTYLRVGVLAAMSAALLHGLVDNFYFVPDLAFAFWLMIWISDIERTPA